MQPMMSLFSIGPAVTRPLTVELEVNGTPTVFQIDTGAAVSSISERIARTLHGLRLVGSTLVLHTYTGEALPAVGRAEVWVTHQGQRVELSLFVVRGEGPALLGRPWLARLHMVLMAPAGGLRRPVPSRLEDRGEEMPLFEFVPPGAPVPFSGRAVAGRRYGLGGCPLLPALTACASGAAGAVATIATISRAGLARRVCLRHDHPTGLVCPHWAGSRAT